MWREAKAVALEGGEPARALVVGLIEQISALGLEVDG